MDYVNELPHKDESYAQEFDAARSQLIKIKFSKNTPTRLQRYASSS